MSPTTIDAREIRRRFLAFFEQRGHTIVPSSSLVPHDDPTLLFVNAGMVQFKDVFTGRDKRPYSRAASVQRCLRAGGKHNDLDNVGFTPRHHTLFEMLGNFSFGDYFKSEAIEWAWQLLTSPVADDGLGIDPDRLCATVFSGEGENAPPDDEAFELWTRFLPPERIYRCSAKDNFWMMGDTGPCGPCSEIHLRLDGRAPPDAGNPGKGPAFEEDRYMELWNLVFMQYEKHADGSMTKLPRPSVDTGAGLERLAAVVEGVSSNFETSLLAPLVALAKELAGRDPSVVGGAAAEAPFRVIADHARATAFLVADGVFPDRMGRSYVLRRIMRRAIRHGTEVGLHEPFFHVVCAKVVEMFGDVYPELVERAATIERVVRTEEEAFRRTLDRGLARLDAAIEALPPGTTAFPPEAAADLYDTFGFPLDLTGVICRERGLELDEAAAEAEVRRRQRAGAQAGLGAGEKVADVYFELKDRLPPTTFTGYERVEDTGEIVAILRDGRPVDAAEPEDAVEIVLDRTPFYAESGGQVGDTGRLVAAGMAIRIEDTTRPVAGIVVHHGVVEAGRPEVGMQVRASVDADRRAAIRRAHSATHLLHHALREELGAHVVQKGSLVAPDRLRFDFSHGEVLTREQRRAIEARVVAEVLENLPTKVEVTGIEDAKAKGAMMLFGEKYGEKVRVVRIGRESIELCGGTHVDRTGDIGPFVIQSETSVAQGVRRIEALTGRAALAWTQELSDVVRDLSAAFRVRAPSELPPRIERLMEDLRGKDREIADLKRRLATAGGSDGPAVRTVGDIRVLAQIVPVDDPKALRAAADELRNRIGSGVVVLGAEAGGKATLLVAATRDVAGSKVHAGKLVAKLASYVDGRGGGRPDLAQAGGPKVAGLPAAIEAAPALVAEAVGAS
ncbi:MAG: alanine--tRNA ligase [Deltaproteobacteria bacterium]|nr:MAG: alanine--tRNA ligase [Deltaproteobacteria bacterium]